jgi:hypothetical protein
LVDLLKCLVVHLFVRVPIPRFALSSGNPARRLLPGLGSDAAVFLPSLSRIFGESGIDLSVNFLVVLTHLRCQSTCPLLDIRQSRMHTHSGGFKISIGFLTRKFVLVERTGLRESFHSGML